MDGYIIFLVRVKQKNAPVVVVLLKTEWQITVLLGGAVFLTAGDVNETARRI